MQIREMIERLRLIRFRVLMSKKIRLVTWQSSRRRLGRVSGMKSAQYSKMLRTDGQRDRLTLRGVESRLKRKMKERKKERKKDRKKERKETVYM